MDTKIASLLDGALKNLESVPLRDLSRLDSSLAFFGSAFPKQSKSLSTNLRKDLFGIREPRLLVITAHLYFDFILNRALSQEATLSARMKRSPFASRLRTVAGRFHVKSATVEDLAEINSLRNRFAHDLFFNLADWEPTRMNWFKSGIIKRPKSKALRLKKHVVLFRMCAFKLMIDLHEEFRWLYLEDVPKEYRSMLRRSPTSSTGA